MSTQEASEKTERLDLRGLMCPEPVLRTKKLLDGKPQGAVEVLVDSDINVMNLTRLANSLGLVLESQHGNEGYTVVIKDKKTLEHSHDLPAPEKAMQSSDETTKHAEKNAKATTVVFIAKDTFGEGDRDFSLNLMNVFLQTILQAGHRPQAILLANTGVRLMDPDSSVSKVLNEFKAAGVNVFACGLCVEFYGLQEKIEKEQITNMFAICEYLFSADKIISP